MTQKIDYKYFNYGLQKNVRSVTKNIERKLLIHQHPEPKMSDLELIGLSLTAEIQLNLFETCNL